MKSKTYKRQQKRVQRILDPWITILGLRWYTINILWYDREKEFKKGNGKLTVFRVWVDWPRMNVDLSVNVPAVKRMEQGELERALVHELGHILVSEMHDPKHQDQEERVVTMLAQALIWTRDLSVEKFKGNGAK